ncbi:type II secretion system secretin GspD [Acinetobacter pittii]|uniref:type II secretion system secretin GspD n=1 Tax=Acinetobacter pittii TaxID=48296 RepID=UPI000837E9D0|nr:type II secretion system secretin GspD [Acinetobacter pittii]AUM27828.1 type II secretion system protein GspD [Acinetobacter pittii]MBJ8432008.1 type II secretion system secretin GspD [Acinetobacter pittii]MBN6529818.1 type II secretion system secretin GspD [Acinetobacter pittii]MEB6672299.1 type II secretion system secretin GspD [Acinetobacter pittii]OCY40213.1 type II secretion system protein GspD [Acinetobacter pittii]
MALLNHQRPLWALLAAAPLIATVSSSVYAQTWKINLRDADLTAFINEVADITGKNFAVDPRVRGNVTVISNKPLNKNEVYDLFLGVLNVNGVVAIPSGNTIKLVPDSNVKNSGIPYDSRNKLRGDQIVTRVIWLENTNPNDLIPALRPLMPQFAHMAAIAGTNALIVSDRAANIYQLENIIRNLDGTGQNDIEAIGLQSSQAEEIITQLEAMSATGASKDFNGARIRIIADNRTNRILVKGDPETRKRIRHMIEMLDVPSADRLGGLKVFRLKYASAKNLSEILQGLVTGQAVSSSNGGGAPASPGVVNSSMVNGQSSGSSGSSISTPSISLNNSSNGNQSNITSFSQGGVSIIADNAQNSLVVKADPQLMREIESAIQQLDIRRQQVLIEAAIIEVSGDDADQLGIQWALGDLSSGIGLLSFSNVGASLASIAAGYLSSGATGAAGAIAAGKNNGDGATFALGNFENSRKAYGALIQALKTNTKSNLLSTPSIVTMDNEEAYIVVGQNVPFVTGSVSTGSSGTVNPYTTVERKDVGVTLKVIPHIGEGGTVRLEVEQEVSNVQSSKGQAADLITNKRAIKTAVLAEHGQTVVLGGLVSDDVEFNNQGIPGLSSIPYLGRLFRSDTRSNVKRNLLVFIHPTIVGDANDVRRLSQQRYSQLYSLQLAMDKNGNFAKLPERVDDVYNQKMTPPSIASQPKNYQQVPSGGKTSTVTTPVAVEPAVQKQTLQLPDPEVNRTKNTVTTTTLRPSTAQ